MCGTAPDNHQIASSSGCGGIPVRVSCRPILHIAGTPAAASCCRPWRLISQRFRLQVAPEAGDESRIRFDRQLIPGQVFRFSAMAAARSAFGWRLVGDHHRVRLILMKPAARARDGQNGHANEYDPGSKGVSWSQTLHAQ